MAVLLSNSFCKEPLSILAFLLRAGSMGAISITWVLTPTAFPTHVRGTAHAVLYTAGSLGPLGATLWPKNMALPLDPSSERSIS